MSVGHAMKDKKEKRERGNIRCLSFFGTGDILSSKKGDLKIDFVHVSRVEENVVGFFFYLGYLEEKPVNFPLVF